MSSRGVPEVLMKKVDEYVDSLAPQIQPRITEELDVFQQKTIDSLEGQVVDAFRSLFNKKGSGDGSRGFSLNDSAPDSYGGQSLPFADEIAKLTKGFSKITDEAGDDLRDIFDLTEGGGGGNNNNTRSRGSDKGDSFSRGAKGFLSAAVNAVQDHLDDRGSGQGSGGGQGIQFDGLLGVLSNTVKDASQHPDEKARLISPEIKEKVGLKLREQHKPIAEQFTRLALEHIKRWLRGNTTARDLGDGVKGEVGDQVKGLVKGIGGLLSSKNDSDDCNTRGFGDRSRDGDDGESGGKGFSKVISEKLSTGLARVHREVRLEFRKILGNIEKQLFELLPDQFQRPLEKILGGNPFDSQLDRDAGGGSQRDRGFRDDIKTKLIDKIRALVRKVQETLRESILGVVNGGHRKFERASWMFVQNMVQDKVQKYLPKVKITVPDDIGNEGVSVGEIAPGARQEGGVRMQEGSSSNDSGPSPQGYSGGQTTSAQSGYDTTSQHQQPQDYRDDYRQSGQNQSRPDHQQGQYNRPNDYQDSYGRQEEPPRQDHQQSQYGRPDDRRDNFRDQEPLRQDYQQSQYGRPDDRHDNYRDQEPPRQDYQQNQYGRSDDRRDDYRRDEPSRPSYQQSQYNRPDDYRDDHRRQEPPRQDFREDQYQSNQGYRDDYRQQGQGRQEYGQQQPYQSDQNQGYSQGQGQGYNQGQGYGNYGQNPRY